MRSAERVLEIAHRDADHVADTMHTSSRAAGGIALRNTCVRCMIPPFSPLA